MSHIGKKSINIPNNVNILIKNNIIKIIGINGILIKKISKNLIINLKDNQIYIKKLNETKLTSKLYGLTRTLINNMIIGVNQKFYKRLILEGIGYKFQLNNEYLLISAGFSYIVKVLIPFNIKIILETNTKILISSIDKEKLGLFAAKIKFIKRPEPYKGKGILYENEIIKRKIGKKGK